MEPKKEPISNDPQKPDPTKEDDNDFTRPKPITKDPQKPDPTKEDDDNDFSSPEQIIEDRQKTEQAKTAKIPVEESEKN